MNDCCGRVRRPPAATSVTRWQSGTLNRLIASPVFLSMIDARRCDTMTRDAGNHRPPSAIGARRICEARHSTRYARGWLLAAAALIAALALAAAVSLSSVPLGLGGAAWSLQRRC